MNPYEVLGVSENASDKEVRSAYLKLVKKYHPDRYQDNPLKNLADEKLKEINEAYDIITRERAQAKSGGGSGSYSGGYSSGGSYGSGSYSNGYSDGHSGGYSSGGSYADPGDNGYSGGSYQSQFARVRQCLNNQSISEAVAILDTIPVHNGEWYYLYGIIYFRSGEYSQAYDYLSQATRLEPNNTEYRQAFNALSSRGSRRYHRSYDSSSETSASSAVCNVCSSLMCADCCCECMGGDFIRCI